MSVYDGRGVRIHHSSTFQRQLPSSPFLSETAPSLSVTSPQLFSTWKSRPNQTSSNLTSSSVYHPTMMWVDRDMSHQDLPHELQTHWLLQVDYCSWYRYSLRVTLTISIFEMPDAIPMTSSPYANRNLLHPCWCRMPLEISSFYNNGSKVFCLPRSHLVLLYSRRKSSLDYQECIEKLLQSYEDMVSRMSLRISFLHSHFNFFPPKLRAVNGVHGERFHRDITKKECNY